MYMYINFLKSDSVNLPVGQMSVSKFSAHIFSLQIWRYMIRNLGGIVFKLW